MSVSQVTRIIFSQLLHNCCLLIKANWKVLWFLGYSRFKSLILSFEVVQQFIHKSRLQLKNNNFIKLYKSTQIKAHPQLILNSILISYIRNFYSPKLLKSSKWKNKAKHNKLPKMLFYSFHYQTATFPDNPQSSITSN